MVSIVQDKEKLGEKSGIFQIFLTRALKFDTSSSQIITNTGYLGHKHVPRVVVVIVRA